MTAYSIVFRKNESINQKAVALWQEKYGILKTGFRFSLTFVFCLVVALLSFFSMFFEDDYTTIGTLLFVCLQTVVFTYMINRTIKDKIVPEMAKNADFRIKACSDETEITLRDEDFEIKTQYKKTNYFYNEITSCHDREDFCLIVVDEHTYPLIISYNSLVEGEKEAFSAMLKEKLQEKYERGV